MTVKNLTIAFYTGPERLFISTLIGHLYDLARENNIILLSEELSEKTQKLILNKNIFPKIIKIIPVNQYSSPQKNWFLKNRDYYYLAQKITKEQKIDVVIVENDICLFEMYLLRSCKKSGSLKIAIQSSLKSRAKETMEYFRITKARNIKNMPLWLSKIFVLVKMYIGHFFVYWILPLTIGQLPFFGKTSFITWNYTTGKRDTDAYAVLFEDYKNILLSEGVDPNKIFLICHPLQLNREFFEKNLFAKVISNKEKVITFLWPSIKVSVDKSRKYIPKEKFFEAIKKNLNIILNELSDWTLQVKIHPNVSLDYIQEVKDFCLSISSRIKVLDSDYGIYFYIQSSDIIVDMAPPSTSIYLAWILNDSAKIIILTDFLKDLRGQILKNCHGIYYIQKPDSFSKLLQEIKLGKRILITKRKSLQGLANILQLISILQKRKNEGFGNSN